MIPAIQNGKLKVKLKEDSLTSSIFQLLTYLPNNLLTNIFQNIIGEKLNEKLGSLKAIEFWAKWNASGTRNKNFVEPDILLSFESLDVIIEAKRYDLQGQNKQQWKNELISYRNEYPNTEKKVALWALGGNKNLTNSTLNILWKENNEEENQIKEPCEVIKTTWLKLLSIIKSEYFKYCRLNTQKELSGIERIFMDLIYSFQIHGFFVGTWIDEVGFEPISLRKISINYFQQNQEKYDSSKWLYSLQPINITSKNIKILNQWKIQTKK